MLLHPSDLQNLTSFDVSSTIIGMNSSVQQVEIKHQFKYWAVFDFANSLLYTNVLLYFPQWLTIENKVSDFWYNAVLVLVTLILLLSAPLFGIWADRIGRRVLFLRVAAALMLAGGFIISAPVWIHFPVNIIPAVGVLGFFIISYSYQLSLTFYDAMLADVSQKNELVRASGIGLSWGWIGAIVGVLLASPIANGVFSLFPTGRLAAIGFSNLLFLAVAIIPLMKLKEPASHSSHGSQQASTQSIPSQLWTDIHGLCINRQILFFLIAYWLYIDVILTLQDNLPIYMERVLGFTDSVKSGVVIALTIGGIISALLAARFVSSNRQTSVLTKLLLFSSIGLVALSTARSSTLFFIVLCCLALFFGAILAISRSLYTQLVPPMQRTEFFGFYSIAERSASILGPLLWGIAVSYSGFTGKWPYTIAMLVLACLMGSAAFTARRLKSFKLDTDHS